MYLTVKIGNLTVILQLNEGYLTVKNNLQSNVMTQLYETDAHFRFIFRKDFVIYNCYVLFRNDVAFRMY